MDTTSDQSTLTKMQEDIHCPLCDYNLRGLAEARCPECGGRFNWDELRDPKRRVHAYLFEHHPERNFWSFWSTLIGGIFPWRFWAELLPQQPSKPRRIVLYSLLYSAVLFAACAIQFYGDCLQYKASILQDRARISRELTGGTTGIRPGARWTSAQDALGQLWLRTKLYFENGGWTGVADDDAVRTIIASYGSINRYLDDLFPAPPSPHFFREALSYTQGRRSFGENGAYLHFLVVIGLWPWFTVAALMIFQITLRRSKLRSSHLVRIAIYSGDVFFWLGCALLIPLTMAAMEMSTGNPGWAAYGRGAWQDTILMLVLYGFMIAWLIFSVRLWIACRKYLRFNHAIATVLSTQIIVGLFVLKLLIVWENGQWM